MSSQENNYPSENCLPILANLVFIILKLYRDTTDNYTKMETRNNYVQKSNLL